MKFDKILMMKAAAPPATATATAIATASRGYCCLRFVILKHHVGVDCGLLSLIKNPGFSSYY